MKKQFKKVLINLLRNRSIDKYLGAGIAFVYDMLFYTERG